jgi:diguanylate cyclase (GGDEF)-like protein
VAKRSSDFAARLGGEEFGVILPNTDQEGAFELAEKLRLRVQGAKVPFADTRKMTSATVSIGLICGRPSSEQKEMLLQFIEKADRNLYTAKNTGRNKVEQSIF